MNRDYVVSLLNRNNIDIIEEKRMNNGLGTVIKTVEGCLVNIYDSGKVNCQGKNKEGVEALLKEPAQVTSSRKVFVVLANFLLMTTLKLVAIPLFSAALYQIPLLARVQSLEIWLKLLTMLKLAKIV